MESPPHTSTAPALASTPLPSNLSSALEQSSPVEGNLDSTVDLEISTEDRTEEERIDEFIRDGCDCSKAPKCSNMLTKETIIKCRQESLELTKDELDLVVMTQIRSLRSTHEQPTYRTSHHSSDHAMTRGRSEYYLHGVRICRKAFLFVHCISRSRYERLVSHYEETGLCTRLHGNSKCLPHNACAQEDISRLTSFVANYARAHGMPLPGRIPGHRSKVMLLHSDQTKVFVYSKYTEACRVNGWNAIGRRKFYDVWNQLLPHIAVSTPSTDLCFTCQQNNKSIQLSGCLSEEEKLKRVKTAQDHLLQAGKERLYYNGQVEVAQASALASKSGGTTPRLAHYSFDFAQQIHYPFDSQQTGPEYFKTGRKCGIFGVCNDGESTQVNYLIDEPENPGKGADCVVSLLHHYLEVHGVRENDLLLQADNCVGQNKNNCIIQYLMWRVMRGLNECIELSFMLSGHTKFSPDRFFGLFKKAFRRSSVSTILEVAAVVDRSTTTGQNKHQLIRSADGTTLVNFYQWTTHLNPYFKPIPNITTYHNFRVCSSQPGIVFLRIYSDSDETRHCILKSGCASVPTGMPEKTAISGMSLERQWYLYEQIRPHCKSTLSADLTCPKPSLPKPKPTTQTPVAATNNSGGSGRKRKCTICQVTGHTKRTCPSKDN